ncbi:DUF5995 family protein [Singulisphaera sp. Ch08]|uniref:DUF5995 family protein n=1 Tax=Singulisphaera sp. Ch08 TaxID=3120278 RepID=A0AAU7CJR2_9BACT
MSIANDLPIGPPYTTIPEVIDGLTELESVFILRRDRRGVFVSAYILITRELQRRIGSGLFNDNEWVERYVLSFANLYRQALEAYGRGDRFSVPDAWKMAFDTSVSGVGLVIQDLMLGINAHINRDLPNSLREVGVAPNRESKYQDHRAVNDALHVATGVVQDRIAALYASGLGILDRLLGNLDEHFTGFSFEAARENAWSMGVALATGDSEASRAQLEESIERSSKLTARMILSPNTPVPWLIDALRAIEQMKPWWEETSTMALARTDLRVTELTLDELRFTERTAMIQIAGAPVRGLATDPPASLDEVIARLGEIIDRFDRERSRLSIYPTVYQRITIKVKEMVEAGGFQDPEWMTRLDLLFADRFFKCLDNYLAGRTTEIPRCWAFAFEAVRTGRTMVVQDIALQIIPRVVFDLPITLREAGLDRDLDKRFHDYETTYELFTTELDDIQDMIARKYSRLVTFEDILAGRLDEMISDVLYTRARKEAWEDGLALLAEPSEERRKRMIRALDRKAINSENEALFTGFPPMAWMCRTVRRLEDLFPGSWSEVIGD